jgi:hypothetical protein
MFQRFVVLVAVAASLVGGSLADAQPPAVAPSTVYEVQINGESFLVEANRQTKLESKEKPGVRYDVAVRIAPTQGVRLNSIQFDYELPAKVEVDAGRDRHSARLIHELGFSLLIGDLGRSLDAKGQQETLESLLQSVTSTLRDAKVEGLDVTKPHERKFGESSARGITVRYRDSKGAGRVCLVYVLSGPNYAATCVADFLDNDGDEVLPLLKKTLDSVRPVAPRR